MDDFATPNRFYQQGPAAPTHIEVHDNNTDERALVPTAGLMVCVGKDGQVKMLVGGTGLWLYVTDSFDAIASALGAVVVTP